MSLDPAKRQRVWEIFEQFLRDRAKTIRNLKIEDLNINPFFIRVLAREMCLNDSESIITWLVNQRWMDGAFTSFGYALQNIARVFSEGSGVEGADILKTKGAKHHHIQVKSGPYTMDKDAVIRITQLLQSAQRRNRGSVALLGICYGNSEQVSSVVKKYVGVDWLSGRRFWEFISDNPNCVDEIYAIGGEVGQSFRDTKGQSLAEILQDKITELQGEFERLYGKGGSTMWQNLLRHNT